MHAKSMSEHYEMNAKNLIKDYVSDALRKARKTADKLDRSDVLSIIQGMDKEGIFLIRGAVKEAADELSISAASVYKYLGLVRKYNKL
jgi:predicted transcriptional regulator YheO